jgi:hypothetical protein
MAKKRICKATQERLVRMMVDRLAAIIVECEETNVNFEFCAKLAREMARKEVATQYFVDTRDREPEEWEV